MVTKCRKCYTTCFIEMKLNLSSLSLLFLQEGLKILAPLLISRLLSFFTPTSGLSKTDAYVTALGLCLVVVTEATIHAPNFFANVRFGLALRIAAGSLVYRKVSV